jgi:hypothetical protein
MATGVPAAPTLWAGTSLYSAFASTGAKPAGNELSQAQSNGPGLSGLTPLSIVDGAIQG